MAKGLQNYVEANTPAIKNDPLITFQTYKSLCWDGLRGTEAYNNLNPTQLAAISSDRALLQQSTTISCN